MTKKLKTALCLIALAVLMTETAAAVTTDSAGNRFDIAGSVIADKSVEGDYVAIGQSVKLESGVSGDIIAAGRTVIITDEGSVQNIFAAGQTVTVHARAVRNIYAAGGDLTVAAGTTAKGAYLVGGAISFGGTAEDAYLAGTSVTADGSVTGNMVIRCDHITFGRNAAVGGHLTVIGTVKPQLPPNIDPAKMTFKRILRSSAEKPMNETGISRFKVIAAAVGVVTSVLIAVLLTLLRGGFFAARAGEFRKRAWKDLLYGLVAFIVVPIGALACMLTVFAIPVSIIVLIAYAVTLYLAPAVAGVILGRLLLPKMNRYPAAILGAAAVKLLLLVPVLRVILFLLCAFYALGITAVNLKPRREKHAG